MKAKSVAISSSGREASIAIFPCWTFPLFNGDGVMNPENHLDQFLAIYGIHSMIEDDVMVIFFPQTLVGPTYYSYLSLL